MYLKYFPASSRKRLLGLAAYKLMMQLNRSQRRLAPLCCICQIGQALSFGMYM
jgi:hypothetical protein